MTYNVPYYLNGGINLDDLYDLSEKIHKNGDREHIQQLLSSLDKLKIKEGYQLDSFLYYPGYYNKSKMEKVGSYFQKRVFYMRKTNADKVFSPRIKRSLFDRIFDKVPRSIEFSNLDYDDNMIIEGPIFTTQCLDKIPQNALEYVNVPFTGEGLWQYYLYMNFINHNLIQIMFNENRYILSGGKNIHWHLVDTGKFDKMDNVSPTITFSGEVAELSLIYKTEKRSNNPIIKEIIHFRQDENGKIVILRHKPIVLADAYEYIFPSPFPT